MKVTVFEVQTEPRQKYKGTREVFPAAPWRPEDHPRFLPYSEDRVIVPLFFEGDHEGHRLFEAVIFLARKVYLDTAHPPDQVNVGRFTFLELCAHIENMAEKGKTIGWGRRTGEATLRIADFDVVMQPGPEHFIQAVPCASWMLSGRTIDPYLVTSPRAGATLRSVPPSRG